jgi:hypothetical protein
MDAPTMYLLQLTVLGRFEQELAEAVAGRDLRQFEHLARRAECPSRGQFGARERGLVDEYRARLVVTGALTAEGVAGSA